MKLKMSLIKTLMLVFVLSTSCLAQVWDPAEDFSNESNPNGVWTYGLGVLPETVPGDLWPISGFQTDYIEQGLNAWYDANLNTAIILNTSAQTVKGLASGQIGLQGSTSRQAAIRWTSPSVDRIFVKGAFGQVAAGENCSQWIVHNDTGIIANRIFVSGEYEFEFYLDVQAGDTLDFVVATATLGDATIVPFACKIYSSDETISEPLSWDLAKAFDKDSNPSSVWTYGLGVLPWTQGDFWPISNSMQNYLQNEINGWVDSNVNVAVFKNYSADAQIGVASGQVGFHASTSRNAAIRWTSPVKDKVLVTGEFGQMASGENASEFIILNDANIIFEKLYTTKSNSFSLYVDVEQGDTIDFVTATADKGDNTIVPLKCVIHNSAASQTTEYAKWSLASSFAKELNPVDEWSFGYHSDGSLDPNSFNVYTDFTDPYNQAGLAAWFGADADAIILNKSNSDLNNLKAGQIGLLAGNSNYAVVKWQAPATGSIDVDAVFGDGDPEKAADIFVVLNGTKILEKQEIAGDYVFKKVLNVYAGDILEFVAGKGDAGASVVALDCTISALPGFGMNEGQIWDAVSDFAEDANPNGDWTYGIGFLPYPPFEGDFWPLWRKISEDTSDRFGDGIKGWWDLYGDGVTYLGSVQYNDSQANVNGIRPNQLVIEPSEFRQLGIRWIAPAAGSVVVTGKFGVLGTSNDASYFIMKNDSTRLLWKEKTFDEEFFSFVLNVKAGDKIDFIGAIGNPGDTNLISFECSIFAQPDFGTSTTCWDAGEQFSKTDNPSGPWSYGYGMIEEPGLDKFIDYKTCYSDSNSLPELVNGTVQWKDHTVDHILFNESNEVVNYVKPGQIGLIPSWEFNSALRWTSPGRGWVYVESLFGNGNPTAEASYSIIHNRAKLISKSEYDGDPLVANCLMEDETVGFAIEVEPGDTIDFVGGYGRFVNDSVVPVDVRISPAAGFDDYTLDPRPSKPAPVDCAAGASLNPVLSWTQGRDGADSYVYFGTNAIDVTGSSLLAEDVDLSGSVDVGDLAIFASEWLSSSPVDADFTKDGKVDIDDFAKLALSWNRSASSLSAVVQGNSFMPGVLEAGETYYWRVDEIKDGKLIKGDVWSFTAGVAEDASSALHNPDMGWQLQESYVVDSAENGSSNIVAYPNDSFEGIDNVMLLFAWSDIEKTQGQYDFSKVNYAYDYWRAKGKKIDLRMSTETLLWWNNATPATGQGVPQYVIDALPSSDVQIRQNENVDYTVVNANNSFYQSRLQSFLAAAAANFDQERPVEYIDLAGFGLWGEWHSGYQYANLAERRNALISIIDAWTAAFPNTYLSLSYSYDPDSPSDYWSGPITYYDPAYTNYYNDFLNYSAFDYALSKPNVTFRRNGCGETVFSNERKLADEAFNSLNYGPMGVEMAGTYIKYRRGISNNFDVDQAVADLLSLHANYSTIVGWDSWRAKVFMDSRPDLFKYVKNRLGYRFMLESVQLPQVVSNGATFAMNMSWTNLANGRAVEDYELVIELRDLSKNLAAQYSAGTIATSSWINGYNYAVDVNVPANVGSGVYEVFVRMIDNRNGDSIELPLYGSVDGAYPVGIITVE